MSLDLSCLLLCISYSHESFYMQKRVSMDAENRVVVKFRTMT